MCTVMRQLVHVFLGSTTTAEVNTVGEPTQSELETRAEEMVSLRKKLDGDVKKNVAVAQERQKKHYDARHQEGSYKVVTFIPSNTCTSSATTYF